MIIGLEKPKIPVMISGFGALPQIMISSRPQVSHSTGSPAFTLRETEEGRDITEMVKKAVEWLTENSF